LNVFLEKRWEFPASSSGMERAEGGGINPRSSTVTNVLSVCFRPPTISLLALAELMGTTSVTRLFRTLRKQKYHQQVSRQRPRKSVEQAIGYLVDGSPLDPTAEGLSPHEQNIVQMLMENPGCLRTTLTCTRPQKYLKPWNMFGVTINLVPDIELHGPDDFGAIQFYTGRRPLAPGVGSALATLMYHYLCDEQMDSKVHPLHCLVIEPQRYLTYSAAPSAQAPLVRLDQTCQLITALWPTI
jgi:hypothetical protein